MGLTPPADPLAEIRAGFFIECDELIEALQDALTRLDAQIAAGAAPDAEAINQVFRAVHSIKGGAGAFALGALVDYAHRFETVLDALRAGRMILDAQVLLLLVQATDQLQDQIRAARDGLGIAGGEAILAALEARGGFGAAAGDRVAGPPGAGTASGGPAAQGAEAAIDFVPLPLAFSFDMAGTSRNWDICLTPAPGFYESGNEVALILRALSALGRATVRCTMPDDLRLDEAGAEQPRLSWQVQLEGEIDRAEIDEIFDFVADVCAVSVTEAGHPETEALTVTLAGAAAPDDDLPVILQAPAYPGLATPASTAGADGGGAADIAHLSLVSLAAPEPVARPTAGAALFPGSAPASGPAPVSGPDSPPLTVRVDLDKIDRLLNLVGELVINQAMLAQSIENAGLATHEVTTGLDGFMALTRDIQDGVMAVRAQPLKPLFQRMARIVREAALATGKTVRLRTEGDATEVDKTLIERLAEPLTHIIRNAVDHGIEHAPARLSCGKTGEGTITLSAHHRAGRILIEIADDGAGIDRERVLGLAIARGLVAPDAGLSEAEIDQLLFMPGFSTVSEVSPLSGRGVGMDVVRNAIGALGGRITLSSTRGAGTIISISLPLTLAVLDGMVVSAAGQTFVVPLSAIAETAWLDPAAIMRIGATGRMLHIRGELIPLIDLAASLGFAPSGAGGGRGSGAGRDGIVLMTAHDDGSRAALIVDAIMEPRQVVIKGLGPAIGRAPGVAAATILGGGQVALILDPSDLTAGLASAARMPQTLALAG